MSAPVPQPQHHNGTDMGCLCDRCAALCCRYVALPIDNPETAKDYDNVRWYLMHENVTIFVDEGQWYVQFATRCKHLRDDNACGVYETRPRICRGYTTDNCDYHGGDYQYEHHFTSAEQLRKHAEEVLGKGLVVKPKPRKKKVRGKTAVELPVG